MSSQHHAPATLRQGKTRYTLNRSLGGPLRQSGRFGEEKSLLALSGFEIRSVQPVA